MTHSVDTLQGIQVVITRPQQQGAALFAQLSARGADVVWQPLLEIEPLNVDPATVTFQFEQADVVVFVSQNAVHALPDIDALRVFQAHGGEIGAIGEQTGAALQSLGLTVSLVPESGFTSEDFLAMPALSEIRERRIVIVRGRGGRELLAQQLMKRGAFVQYIEVYRRRAPASLADGVGDALSRMCLRVIMLTSAESVLHLVALLPAGLWAHLRMDAVLCGSERIARAAREAGFVGELLVAADPSDAAMTQALIEWAN